MTSHASTGRKRLDRPSDKGDGWTELSWLDLGTGFAVEAQRERRKSKRKELAAMDPVDG